MKDSCRPLSLFFVCRPCPALVLEEGQWTAEWSQHSLFQTGPGDKISTDHGGDELAGEIASTLREGELLRVQAASTERGGEEFVGAIVSTQREGE